MPAARDDLTIAEFTMDDYAVIHVLWQRADLCMRPSDGPEERFRRLGALKAKTQILMGNEPSRAFFSRRGYLREDDCEPWGKELVEGGAPPCR